MELNNDTGLLYNQMESCRQVWTALKEDLIKFRGSNYASWNHSVGTGSVQLWHFFPAFYSRISKIILKLLKKEKRKSWSEVMNLSLQKRERYTAAE